MAHMTFHAESSARRFGGEPTDYYALHQWFDATKEHMADFRHRALRHHSQGIFEAERVFGVLLPNGVPTRLVAEMHVKQDCGGRIPDVRDWLGRIAPEAWMNKGYQHDH